MNTNHQHAAERLRRQIAQSLKAWRNNEPEQQAALNAVKSWRHDLNQIITGSDHDAPTFVGAVKAHTGPTMHVEALEAARDALALVEDALTPLAVGFGATTSVKTAGAWREPLREAAEWLEAVVRDEEPSRAAATKALKSTFKGVATKAPGTVNVSELAEMRSFIIGTARDFNRNRVSGDGLHFVTTRLEAQWNDFKRQNAKFVKDAGGYASNVDRLVRNPTDDPKTWGNKLAEAITRLLNFARGYSGTKASKGIGDTSKVYEILRNAARQLQGNGKLDVNQLMLSQRLLNAQMATWASDATARQQFAEATRLMERAIYVYNLNTREGSLDTTTIGIVRDNLAKTLTIVRHLLQSGMRSARKAAKGDLQSELRAAFDTVQIRGNRGFVRNWYTAPGRAGQQHARGRLAHMVANLKHIATDARVIKQSVIPVDGVNGDRGWQARIDFIIPSGKSAKATKSPFENRQFVQKVTPMARRLRGLAQNANSGMTGANMVGQVNAVRGDLKAVYNDMGGNDPIRRLVLDASNALTKAASALRTGAAGGGSSSGPGDYLNQAAAALEQAVARKS